MNITKAFYERQRSGQMTLTKDTEQWFQLRLFAHDNQDVIKNYMFKEDVKKIYMTSIDITDSDSNELSYVVYMSNSLISDLKIIRRPRLFLEINHMIREDVELDLATEIGRYRDLSEETFLFFMNVQDNFIKKKATADGPDSEYESYFSMIDDKLVRLRQEWSFLNVANKFAMMLQNKVQDLKKQCNKNVAGGKGNGKVTKDDILIEWDLCVKDQLNLVKEHEKKINERLHQELQLMQD